MRRGWKRRQTIVTTTAAAAVAAAAWKVFLICLRRFEQTESIAITMVVTIRNGISRSKSSNILFISNDNRSICAAEWVAVRASADAAAVATSTTTNSPFGKQHQMKNNKVIRMVFSIVQMLLPSPNSLSLSFSGSCDSFTLACANFIFSVWAWVWTSDTFCHTNITHAHALAQRTQNDYSIDTSMIENESSNFTSIQIRFDENSYNS